MTIPLSEGGVPQECTEVVARPWVEILVAVGPSLVWIMGVAALLWWLDSKGWAADLIKRLTDFGPAKFSPGEPGAQNESNSPSPDSSSASKQLRELQAKVGGGHSDPDAPIVRMREGLRAQISGLSDKEAIEHLLTVGAGAQLIWVFEALNFTILGSQIELLLRLTNGPVSLAEARQYYDQAARANADHYADFSFEAWLFWLEKTAFFVDADQDSVEITTEGRDFLTFLTQRKLPLKRWG